MPLLRAETKKTQGYRTDLIEKTSSSNFPQNQGKVKHVLDRGATDPQSLGSYSNSFGRVGSPILFVLSKNLHRRHLTTSQRAAIAAEAELLLRAESKKTQGFRSDLTEKTATSTSPRNRGEIESKSAKSHKSTRLEAVAEAMKVGRVTVEDALRVKREAPEDFERIKRGGGDNGP